MTTQLITPPAALPVSMTAARLAVRADGTDMDAAIQIHVAGIVAHVQHFTGRSIINQTWRLTLDLFPDAIKLFNPPISSVSWIKFYDTNNVLQTLDPADYTVDTTSELGYIVPAPNKAWPATYDKINAVQVQYTAGYGSADTDTPDDIKMYILAKLTEQFDAGAKPNPFLESLLDAKRIWCRS